MGMQGNGGQMKCRRVAIGNTWTLLTTPLAYCGGRIIQQDGTVDVRLNGVQDADHTVGYLLAGTPVTTPATRPDQYVESVSNQPIYGVVAGGTGSVLVIELY
jgi:hypothetical protein